MEKISQEITEENADGTFGLDLLVNKSKKKSDTKDENISDINSIEKISENILEPIPGGKSHTKCF